MAFGVLTQKISGFVVLFCTVATGAQAITGGENCSAGVRRHVVKIIGPSGQYCSGTVVGPRKVVTAAHCFRSQSAQGWTVVAPSGGWGGSSIRVSAIRIHPRFNPQALSGTAKINDIAVVKLAEPLPSGMVPAAMGGDALRKGEVTVAGYGGNALQQVTLRPKDAPLTSNGDAILVASGAGACSGDSGGPVFRKAGGGWVLVGVVSWTEGACGSMTAVTPMSGYRGFVNAGD